MWAGTPRHVGPDFLVMELVEGENLSGPLPVETALNYARQIAEALNEVTPSLLGAGGDQEEL